ncbi:hypothetical protein PR001_g24139 [Phytophthora rubi]|uniref:RxLR effector protein n=1 Tax=Phytophthora rubi TaxID=129364 RepID=A0A6A3ID06_9STRA|nr:hypothetical protein PR001_g24139 [Phytophthora rubi]
MLALDKRLWRRSFVTNSVVLTLAMAMMSDSTDPVNAFNNFNEVTQHAHASGLAKVSASTNRCATKINLVPKSFGPKPSDCSTSPPIILEN